MFAPPQEQRDEDEHLGQAMPDMTDEYRGLTAREFAAMPREGLRLELVRGEIVAMPPAFANHGVAAAHLGNFLGWYIASQELGVALAATRFELAADTMRAPDFAFIQASRVTPGAIGRDWVRVVPDLVVEVVSSGDRPRAIGAKVRMWLDAGVWLVWVVYPTRKRGVVHRSGVEPVTLGVDDQLDGADVVPGFTAQVATILG